MGDIAKTLIIYGAMGIVIVAIGIMFLMMIGG